MPYKVTYTDRVQQGSIAFPFVDGHALTLEWSAVVDVNGDGRDDLFVIPFGSETNAPESVSPGSVMVLVSTGTGFVDGTATYLPEGCQVQGPRSVHVADFNGDGKLDVYIANGGTEAIQPFPGEQNRLLLSQTNGTWKEVSATNLPQMMSSTHTAAIGDFDGDGDLDIFDNVIGSAEAHFPTPMLNNRNGGFTIRGQINSGFVADWFPDDVEGALLYTTYAFDMNGDGYDDIWTSGFDYFVSWPTLDHTDFRALINDGNGHFAFSEDTGSFPSPAGYPGVIGEFGQRASDVDHDGDLDFFVFLGANNAADTYYALYLNDGDGNFTEDVGALASPDYAKIPFQSSHFYVTDLDGDGDDDVFLPKYGMDDEDNLYTNIIAFENDGAGNFAQIDMGVFEGKAGINSTVVEVNGDGIKDFLVDVSWGEYPEGEGQFYVVLGRLDVAVNRTGWELTDDRIYGGSKNDTLSGLGGDDRLQGNAGNDMLRGMNGAVALIGSLGRDTLVGGAGADTFVFNAVLESKKGANRDIIQGFSRAQSDRIDLSGIDADQRGASPGNDAFVFIGTKTFAAYHAAHKAVYGMVRVAPGGIVQINVNANLGVDAEIKVTGLSALKAIDFHL